MRILTGVDQNKKINHVNQHYDKSFEFNPQSINTFGNIVIVEGCDYKRSISWVHAWTISEYGVITQVREYFNTSLTVTRLGSNLSDPKMKSKKSSTPVHCPSVWESSLSSRVGKSVPGLVLAI